jgi:AcrR family transcriptional regulator
MQINETGEATVRIRRGEGRERILKAASDLFAERGFDAVSTANIAELAETSNSAVLYHFESKETLWREAMKYLFIESTRRPVFEAAAYKDLDGLTRLKVILRSFIIGSSHHPKLGRIIIREAATGGPRLDWLIEEIAVRHYDLLDDVIRECLERGLIKPYSQVLLRFMIRGAATNIFSLSPMSSRFLHGDPFAPEVVEEQADMVIDTLLTGIVIRD